METQSGSDQLDYLDIIPEFGSDDGYEEGIQEYLGVSVQEFHKKAKINDGRYEYEKWPDARTKESSFAESANMLSQFGITAADGIYLCDDMDQQSFLLDVIKNDKMSSLLVPFKCVLSEGMFLSMTTSPQPSHCQVTYLKMLKICKISQNVKVSSFMEVV